MTEPLRIFITGASASLMGDLISKLATDGHILYGLSRKAVAIPGVEMIKADLHDPGIYGSVLSSCDMLIHAAAVTHSHDESEYERVNVHATKQLLDHCPEGMAIALISSRTAGLSSGAYGKSKWDAEQLVMDSGSRYLILRPAEVFGAGKEEGIEQLIQDAMHKPILPYPAGVDSPMSPIHVVDLTDLMYSRILRDRWPLEPVILNGPENMDFSRFFQIIKEVSGHSPFLLPVPAILMRLMAHVARILPGRLPFTADQVARLYSVKETAAAPALEMMTLRRYVEGLMQLGKSDRE